MKRKQTQKIEFDQSIVKSSNIEIPLRPNSSKLAHIVKSPLPLKKSMLSQHQNQRKNQQELPLPQDMKIIKIRSITPNQQRVFQYHNASPAKLIQKQPQTQSDKKILVITKRPEKQQFRITKKINSSVERNNSPFKAGSPNQGYEQYWVNSESTEEIDFKKQKKNNIREQHYKQQKQEFKNHLPKCAQDFSMTSHKNDLHKLLKNYQQEIKETRQLYMHDNSPPLNMSEIMEINEDGLSSLAQSTYHHQLH
ncbi:unnamed protein product (macronuclear) [Paramecium tetraurelia]|uniref:Uncharacterized protein n=1 Tax=Paramecium tetraurelia TaxID=5888 RepID=A0CTJ0_PARTE|nr:uncharacterized protein GSPATT00010341001 [Paramecium tetraurelia]CAK74107.1 unnamed protein product [Paramecium tetraurelia]|eukprot:XP_001441504.1 hypothetical protein (macronuclear) [Paramecium tetraurelia strain d4-2]